MANANNLKSTLKGHTLKSQAREVVSNVYLFMKEEAKNKSLTIPLVNARKRTAAATGVSERLVTKIHSELKRLKESGDNENKHFTSPDKNRKRQKPITGLDDFDKCLLRRLVYNFHLQHKQLPTTELLLEKLKEHIDFKGGKTSLRLILKEMGFKWRKTQNNRKILIENEDIREKRIAYLRQIKRFREEGRPIIYVDETYVHANHHSSYSWSDNTDQGFRAQISKGDRLVIIHAGGEKGFVPNALAMWRASAHSGDYHDNVNTTIFNKWLIDKLLPNLEPRSVIVIDNAPYHNTQVDKAPTSKSKKQEMRDWLTKYNIPYSDDMFVPELYKLVTLHKHRFIRYVTDEIVEKEGHVMLRLPPYHPDLNPIELIWADVKGHVSRRNTSSQLVNIQADCEEKMASMGSEHWVPKCNHVKNIEDEYAAKEVNINELTESFVINPHDSDSESEDEPATMSGIEELDGS